MPGLSFICDPDRSIEAMLPEVHGALEAACHDATYHSALLAGVAETSRFPARSAAITSMDGAARVCDGSPDSER